MATQLSITYNEPGTGRVIKRVYTYGPGETELEALLFVLKAFHFIYDQEVRKHIEYDDEDIDNRTRPARERHGC